MYPIQEIYENTFKNIPTMRIYEFIESQNKATYEMNHEDFPHGGQNIEQKSEPIKKSDISFNSHDSYEPLEVPKVQNKPKPKNIPKLNFEGLPEYETSSEEGDEHMPQNNQYNYPGSWMGMKQCNTNSIKDSQFELSKSSIENNQYTNAKKSAMYSKSNQRSSSIDFKMSESF